MRALPADNLGGLLARPKKNTLTQETFPMLECQPYVLTIRN